MQELDRILRIGLFAFTRDTSTVCFLGSKTICGLRVLMLRKTAHKKLDLIKSSFERYLYRLFAFLLLEGENAKYCECG